MQLKSDQAPFGWGIVGAGAIARQFASDLRLVPGAYAAAFHTRSGTIAGDLSELAPQASVHPTLDALLADPAVEAVYIATPNTAHAPQAIAAIEAGKPVLVEKPLATTSADAARIEAEAAARGVFAMEAMWTRFLPAVRAAGEILSSGRIGDIVSVEAELAYRKDERDDGRFFDPALGGGASLDLGVYGLSLALALLGTPTRSDGRWKAARSGVDMSATYELEFGPVYARISCGFDRDGDNAFLVNGTDGALLIHPPFLKAQRLTVFDGWSKDLPLIGARRPGKGLTARIIKRLPLPGRHTTSYFFAGNGLQFEAVSVMQAVRTGGKASEIALLRDSVAVLELIESVLKKPANEVT